MTGIAHETKQAAPVAPQATANLDGFELIKKTVTFGFAIDTDKDGKIVKTPALYPAEKAQQLEAEGKFEQPDDKQAGTVTWGYYQPKTWDAVLSLADTAEHQEELIKTIQRGIVPKLNNRVDAKLLSLDDDGCFTLSEDDLSGEGENTFLDMTAEILASSKSRRRTPEMIFWAGIDALGIPRESKKAQKMFAAWASTQDDEGEDE